MFTKNNTYLFPQVSSSSLDHHHHHHHPRPPVADLNGVEIFLHHHPDEFSGHYYNVAANNVPVSDNYHHNSTFLHHDDAVLSDDEPQKKQTVKKDRHSKIFTSQGPRDRRVRLSIGIARKFFDLQEMLNFDKPSKTLDWLLTKSKAAIKELVQTKEKGGAKKSTASAVPSDCEPGNVEGYLDCGEDSKGKSGNKNGKGGSSSDLAKESRAKARARARERTREKMCIKQLKKGANLNPLFSNTTQYDKNSHLGVFHLYAGAGSSSGGLRANVGNREGMFHRPSDNEGTITHHQDLTQESVAMKRKSNKNPNSFLGFQQNVVVSRDSNSDYGGIPGAENWDICSFTPQSNMSAVFVGIFKPSRSSNILDIQTTCEKYVFKVWQVWPPTISPTSSTTTYHEL
ncbi:hypothetical protein OROGR_006945 [Orobanche gracilis]